MRCSDPARRPRTPEPHPIPDAVFALWRVPTLLPVVFTPSPVSRNLINGADLMLPGMRVTLHPAGDFAEGDLVAVCAIGNPAPFAVGTAAYSTRDVARRLATGAGLSGKGVEVSCLCLSPLPPHRSHGI